MAVTTFIYNSFKLKIFDSSTKIDLSNGGDTIKLALLANTYTPSIDNHEFFDDVSAHEVSATGYTAGGQTIANQAVSQDNTGDEGVYDGDNVTWANSSITARYAVLYKDTGTPGTSPLIGYIDFGEDKESEGDNFIVSFDAEGIINAN